MKKLLSIVLATALLAGGALAEPTALDAFHALVGSAAEQEASASVDEWLDAALAGRFDSVPEDASGKAAFAENLEPLAAITNGDLAAYASAHGLPVGQVRNAWYRALANVLSAGIELDPASGDQRESARAILALFLSMEGDGEGERREIRSQMTEAYSQRIAEVYSLPKGFVDFVIMDEDWDDDSWENDGDWQEVFDWDDALEDAFEDIAIGSRDGDGSTRIADLQELLISLGYLKGKADGVFGPRTQAALIEFQLANGLPGTGVYSSRSLRRARSADAVARWDYGKDFWDSTDYDTDGDTPDTPDKADTPDRKDTPDTPDKNDTPDTPDKKDTPEKQEKKKQEKKQKKQKKDSPDTPDSPDSPD